MKLPKRGEITRIEHPDNGAILIVRKCTSCRDWTARIEGVTDHCRFGNAQHIREDIEHFLMCGTLPRGEHW